MSEISELPPDGSWADPISRKERHELTTKLARACRITYSAARVTRRNNEPALSLMLTSTCAEIQELHLDVTERAKVAAS